MKRTRIALALALLQLVAGCDGTPAPFGNAHASGHYSADIVQCSLYAREVSGLGLYGDADGWWHAAGRLYMRGSEPRNGSVLVLTKTPRMHSGHVAVVKQLLGPRLISVTHSNWGADSKSRHIVYYAMQAQDVSPGNDWSLVRFWNYDKGVFGFPYAAYGFIYP